MGAMTKTTKISALRQCFPGQDPRAQVFLGRTRAARSCQMYYVHLLWPVSLPHITCNGRCPPVISSLVLLDVSNHAATASAILRRRPRGCGGEGGGARALPGSVWGPQRQATVHIVFHNDDVFLTTPLRFHVPVQVHFLKKKWVGRWEKGSAMCPSPIHPRTGTPHGWVSRIVRCSRTGAKGRAVLTVKRRTCAG